ncbi:MAG: S-methyl-5'-thioadenosine phosphorylase [Chloroflexi bacterium]|nr:MAG: S-methyl-5'-thioadenosine phosphorylase [Chloroflexota bacterium]
MEKVRIGIIGGSGLYQMEGLTDIEEVKISTPFGDPSDAIVIGTLEGERVAFLPRHGRGHRFMPSEVNYRANIWALKSLGVERIISVTACGSMKEEIAPRDIVIPDQLFDNTKGKRAYTFFGEGIVVHISFAEPFCPELSELLYQAVKKTGARVHRGGTFITIEGPRFSTKGESRIYRQWGVDIIGMTAVPEAQLAREAEICYAAMAHVTDYDVWHESEEPVTVEMVIKNLLANLKVAQEALRYLIPTIPKERHCTCGRALADAIITQRDMIPPELKEKLDLLIGKYLK